MELNMNDVKYVLTVIGGCWSYKGLSEKAAYL